jgi:hypothetical protein
MSKINPEFEPNSEQGACQKHVRPVRCEPQNIRIQLFSRS